MNLTLEFLQTKRAEAEQRQQQAVADLNAVIGEMRMLDALIKEAQKEPEPEELN